MTVIKFPYRRPPLIECPTCDRLMSDVQQHGIVIERFCATCKTTDVGGPTRTLADDVREGLHDEPHP